MSRSLVYPLRDEREKPRMGCTLEKKKSGMPKLQLVRDETSEHESCQPPKRLEMKSAIAKELHSFADELDKQIAQLLNM